RAARGRESAEYLKPQQPSVSKLWVAIVKIEQLGIAVDSVRAQDFSANRVPAAVYLHDPMLRLGHPAAESHIWIGGNGGRGHQQSEHQNAPLVRKGSKGNLRRNPHQREYRVVKFAFIEGPCVRNPRVISSCL